MKPIKFHYFNLKNQSKVYVPDFMVMLQPIPSQEKQVYLIIEVPNLKFLTLNSEYLYKLDIAKLKLDYLSKQSDVAIYKFEVFHKAFFLEKIDFYQKFHYLSFFENVCDYNFS